MAENATAVNNDAGSGTATATSAPAEKQDTGRDIANEPLDFSDVENVDDDFAEKDDDADNNESEESDNDNTDAEETDKSDPAEEIAEDAKPTKADERKTQLNSEIRDLVTTRNQLRTEVAAINAKVYEARTPDQIAEQEGVSPEMAEIQAMREERELEKYNNQVAESQLTIRTEVARGLQDFPMFDENSSEFNKDLAAQVDELLADNIIRDTNTEQVDAQGNKIPGTGQITGAHISNYKLLKIVADATKLGSQQGEKQGQKAVKKMLATADSTSSAGPSSTKKDSFASAFDKELDKYM